MKFSPSNRLTLESASLLFGTYRTLTESWILNKLPFDQKLGKLITFSEHRKIPTIRCRPPPLPPRRTSLCHPRRCLRCLRPRPWRRSCPTGRRAPSSGPAPGPATRTSSAGASPASENGAWNHDVLELWLSCWWKCPKTTVMFALNSYHHKMCFTSITVQPCAFYFFGTFCSKLTKVSSTTWFMRLLETAFFQQER